MLKLGPLALGVRDPAGYVNRSARLGSARLGSARLGSARLGNNSQISYATHLKGSIDVHVQTERLKPLARAGESLETDQWAIV